MIDYNGIYSMIANDLRDRKLALFLGSGISVDPPYCLPSGEMLKGRMISFLVDFSRNLLEDSVVSIAESQLESIPFEMFWDKFIQVLGNDCLRTLNVLRSENNNINNECIARLAKKGYIKFVMTLNFDLLLERALANEGLTVSSIYRDEEYKECLSFLRSSGARSTPGVFSMYSNYMIRYPVT